MLDFKSLISFFSIRLQGDWQTNYQETGSYCDALSTTMYGLHTLDGTRKPFILKHLRVQALRFNARLRHMASRMVKEIKKRSKDYVAIHLRFEVDAVAYSMCAYDDGGEAQLEVLWLHCVRL